jgi:hypothetical protein
MKVDAFGRVNNAATVVDRRRLHNAQGLAKLQKLGDRV